MAIFSLVNIIDSLVTKEVLIVVAIIAIILFAYFALWFFDYLKKHEEKKKLQNNTMELNKLVDEVRSRKDEKVAEVISPSKRVINEMLNVDDEVNVVEKVDTVEDEPIISNLTVENESVSVNDLADEDIEILEQEKDLEGIKYKEEVYTKEEAKSELERLTKVLMSEEASPNNINIELTKFETEQEENAIISLDELIAKEKTITVLNEETQYQDDGNEPITIQELEERYKMEKAKEIETKQEDVKRKKVSIDDFLSAKIRFNSITTSNVDTSSYNNSSSTYRPSPVISPIYGIEKEPVKKNVTLELENTANFQKFDDELRRTNEFLAKLKDLKEKLD